MIRSLFVLGSTLAAGAAQPKSPCTLVTQAEVQAITPKMPVGAGVPIAPDPIGTAACEFKWGSGNNAQSGRYHLSIATVPIAKAFPGTRQALIQQGLVGTVKPGAVDSAVIAGVGDAATYESNAVIRSTAITLVKGTMLTVELEAPDGRAKRPEVIALLKAAAGRL